MSEQEYNSLKVGDYVRLKYSRGSFSRSMRKLLKKNGNYLWFKKVVRSWTINPNTCYTKWNAIRWLEVA